tara:strand:- start:163 stop:1197 length:1035 start_codon:yes stop_codon:yes gene_type:complete
MIYAQSMKEVNLNAFSEKLLHRYLLECYYGMLEEILPRDFLPDSCRWKKINLVVPEKPMSGTLDDGSDYTVRPDLVIYFTDGTNLAVEVKWQSSGNYGKNQLHFLRENNGHIVCLVNDEEQEGVTLSVINFEHWQRWLGRRSMSLAMDTLISKGSKSEGGRQYWIVSPRGSKNSTTNSNYIKMRESRGNTKRAHFWAFRNDTDNVKNQLKIRRGDIILFLMVNTLGLGLEKGQWLMDEPKWSLNVFKWIEYEVEIPYSIDVESDLATFFEDEDKPETKEPGGRVWPHFIHMKLIQEGERVHLEERGDMAGVFRSSSSPNLRSGGPIKIDFEQYEALLTKLVTHD